MAQTKKNIVDSISGILTKFKITDDFRVRPTWLSYKIDSVRAELINKQYAETGILDQAWLSDLGLVSFHRTNFADDNSVTCACDVAKTTIPQVISLNSNNGNQDLGLYAVMSVCGTKNITPRRMFQWGWTPSDNSNSLFTYYNRINTQMYVSDPTVNQLRVVAILLNPEDGYLKNSNVVASGSVVSGTVYVVKGGQVIYNNVVYNINDTVTANATATYTGLGKLYLDSEIASYTMTDPYPASGEMIRQIEMEILTKEFRIEAGQVADLINDSLDDASKK